MRNQQWENFWNVLKEKKIRKKSEILSAKFFKDIYREVVGEKNWKHYYSHNHKSKGQLRDALMKYIKLYGI